MNRLLALALLALTAAGSDDWLTHRGGPARTGNADGQPGPGKPRILWTHASSEHYVASLVASGDRLFVPALGAFNTGSFHAIDLADKAAKRILWTKSAPLLRVPAVCAPAVVDGKIVLGEGMHQTDGAGLLCLRATDGRPLWRLQASGNLVHMEGSPTVAGGRVFIGAGNGGVYCVDMTKVTLEGKEIALAEAEAKVDAQWKTLAEKYEIDKKKDPDFAIPPDETKLPQPSPKVWWQQGKDRWHVDGPTLFADGKVLAGSAYLDVEKLGERALFCMSAENGNILWQTPLKFNPWGGPTVAGGRVLVTSSSIRYDPQAIKGAQGEVLALKLADGTIEWRREIDAGVLGCVALAGDLAVFTDTAGRVQAVDAKSGHPKWSSLGGTPFFAAPIVARDVVYAADLRGTVTALSLAEGKTLWKLDAAGAVGSPGMVYGSPILHHGRIYLGTANLEGETAGKPTFLTCIGSE